MSKNQRNPQTRRNSPNLQNQRNPQGAPNRQTEVKNRPQPNKQKSSTNKKKKGFFDLLFGGEGPKTVQDTIPYKYISSDGICELPDNKFNKTITFADINYELAEPGDQQLIFEGYCKFLNYYNPEVEVQLACVNAFANKSEAESSISIAKRNDKFNSVRNEFSQVLKRQFAQGNNGLRRNKYITFTIEAKNFKDAKTRLERAEMDIINNFKQMGVRSWPLNGKERVQLLHSQLHPDGKEKCTFDWKDIAQSGMSTKDIIAPSSFNFKEKNTFMMGDMFGSVQMLHITTTELPDDLLKQLLNIESALTVSIHMKTVEQGEALKAVKRKITDIDSMMVAKQKQANKEGFDPNIMPGDIMVYSDEAKKLLKELQNRNERMFLVTVVVMNLSKSKEALNNDIATVRGIAQKESCEIRPLDYQQEQGFVSSLVIGKNEIKIERGLTTSSTAVFVPFTTSELFEKGQTWYYGQNALSGNMIMCSRKNLVNPNGLILGIPGSGKTFAAKFEIINTFFVSKDDIIIVDPEGEYSPLAARLDGQIINLSQESKHFINPLDIHDDYGDGEDPIALKSNFLLSLFELIVSRETGLQPEEKSIIDKCVREVYRQYLLDPQPEKMPILGDLLILLEKEAESGKFAEAAKYLANCLELYTNGSLNLFNNRTNVNMNNRIICFNIKELQSHLKAIGMLILQDAVWGRVSKNREKKRHTWYYCDEFHLLLKDEQTASYSVGIWKRFRKWGGIPTGITQNIKDFLGSKEVENIFENTPFILMLNQAPGDRVILAQALGISLEQLSFVTNAGAGRGLLFHGDTIIPFKNSFPKETELYRLMTSKLEEA